ncbi:unnamed protein product [Leuciscus chuanchicus]
MCLALPSDLASVAGGLGSVLLVLTLCSGTFIILKKRKRKSGTALFQQNMQHNTETELMYEEIPNTDVTMVTSSSNQTPASHHNNCTHISTVYATVTNRQPYLNPSYTHSTNQVTDTAAKRLSNFIMLDVLLLFSSICTAVVVGASQTISGYRGERVDIRCSYESGYESYSKYFCKGECNYGFRNIMVESGSPAKDERFSLTDDTTARVFTVTITDLRTEDEGQYWCGVEKTVPLPDVYSEIMLLIKLDTNTTEVSTISPSSKTPSSFSPTELNPQSATHQTETETTRTTTGNTTVELYQTNTYLASVAGGLGSVLLVLTLCSGTFIILKKRKRKSGTALFQQNMQHNTETERMYEEIPNTDVTMVTSSSNQTPASSSNQTPASSSNQTPASHLNNCTEISTVYATVTNRQPDSNPSYTHSTNQTLCEVILVFQSQCRQI